MTAPLRIGSLFSGYGGLDMAAQQVFGGELVFVSDISPGACKLLAHRHPDVPNLGDITGIDWTPWQGRVDILTGGFPCQDLSTAGARAGLRDGTRSGLWAEMARAIQHLQPRWVVFENVRGFLSAPADSDVEPCPWCMGDDPHGTMRAPGVVFADLADLGYDAQWIGLPLSALGGCHHRFRVFGLAHRRGGGI